MHKNPLPYLDRAFCLFWFVLFLFLHSKMIKKGLMKNKLEQEKSARPLGGDRRSVASVPHHTGCCQRLQRGHQAQCPNSSRLVLGMYIKPRFPTTIPNKKAEGPHVSHHCVYQLKKLPKFIQTSI